MDTRGEISVSGALLPGLDAKLQSGDVIEILYAGKKARYRVVWVRASGTSHPVQVAVHRFADDECPWKDLLTEEHPQGAVTMSPSLPRYFRLAICTLRVPCG